MSAKHKAAIQFDLLTPRGRMDFRESQEWLDWLHATLPRPAPMPSAPRVLDLFAGCGGLGLGFEAAGFVTHGYEMKSAAARTYALNLHGGCDEVKLDIGDPTGACDILIGGPPCQPFSQIGYQRGQRDPRDGFPVFLDAVERLRPRIAIIENVRGLLFRNKDYLVSACRELERFGYAVDARLLNAKDYGTPQNRERVVIVASTNGWAWPDPVVATPISAGIALGQLAIQVPPDAKFLTESMDRYIAEYELRSHCVTPRDLHLDRPARTLTCRNFGAATSDMQRIRLVDGRRRMLTTREGARLQAFPDWFEFTGNAYEKAEQIGNAVSPLMSLALARQAWAAMESPMVQSPRRPADLQSVHEETPAQTMVRQALTLLNDVGVNLRDMPVGQRDRVAMAMLAVAGLKPGDKWVQAKSYLEDQSSPTLSQRQILHFWNTHYGTKLADSSYDDVKRKALIHLESHQIVLAGARDPNAAINDSTRGHALTLEGLALIRSYGGKKWPSALGTFQASVPNLAKAAAERRRRVLVPIELPGGRKLELTPSAHNTLQQAIVRDFLGGFVPDAQVLYVADAARKRGEDADLRSWKDEAGMASLGLQPLRQGQKMVDVIAFSPGRNWLFLIEAVHSSNPLTPVRHQLLRQTMRGCKAGRVYVTAFATKTEFRKYAADISWETEVWIADNPDHLIHFNGDRFLGPHAGDEGDNDT
jgi:site-specific DNA-cytosine methylase